MKGDISPDLRDFKFPSPDHQTWADFTRFGEKSPGVGTLATTLDPVFQTSGYARPTVGSRMIVNKLTSVFHASVLLLIMNFVITLSK